MDSDIIIRPYNVISSLIGLANSQKNSYITTTGETEFNRCISKL